MGRGAQPIQFITKEGKVNIKKLSLVFMLLTFSSICFADVILLKSGNKVDGEIKEKTDEYIKVRINDINVTYWLDEIDKIDDSVVSANKEDTNTQIIADYKADNSLQGIDEEKIFLERLSLAFLKPSENSINDLWKFAADYPQSRFADDAQIFYIFTSFIGSVIQQDKVAVEKYISLMERVVKNFSEGKIEEETQKKLEELGQGTQTSRFLIPNNQILYFMHGFWAIEIEEYEKVIANYSLLKDRLDFSKDTSEDGDLVSEIYCSLMVANIKSKNFDEARNIANEAIKKFPKYTWPTKWLKLVSDASTSQK